MSRLLNRLRKGIPGQARDDESPTTVTPSPTTVIPAKAGISDAIVFQAAALVLAYPDEALLDRLDVIEAALADTWTAEHFAPVIEHLRGKTVPEPDEGPPSPVPHLTHLQSYHVQEFDLSRKHALHLSYWTDGDTRRRGEVLAEVKRVYRDSGLLVDTGGELPDYLPMVLEFAVADPERGRELLQRFRASLELIRLGLAADRLPHAGVLEAICRCLPGESPKTRAEVQARFGEVQPVELVGLDSLARTEIPAFAGMTEKGSSQAPTRDLPLLTEKGLSRAPTPDLPLLTGGN